MHEPEASALSRFHRDYRPGLIAFFLRRVRNPADAEDLTQEVFIRIAAQADANMRSADAYRARGTTCIKLANALAASSGLIAFGRQSGLLCANTADVAD